MKLSFGGMKILILKRAPLNHMTIQLIVSYISFFNWNYWPKKLGFQDQYLHPMQVKSSLDKKFHFCVAYNSIKKIRYWLLLIIWPYG